MSPWWHSNQPTYIINICNDFFPKKNLFHVNRQHPFVVWEVLLEQNRFSALYNTAHTRPFRSIRLCGQPLGCTHRKSSLRKRGISSNPHIHLKKKKKKKSMGCKALLYNILGYAHTIMVHTMKILAEFGYADVSTKNGNVRTDWQTGWTSHQIWR